MFEIRRNSKRLLSAVRIRVRMDFHNHIRVLGASSVVTMCWLFLLTTLPQSNCEFDYSDCKKQTYNCGKLEKIYYPFWGPDRAPECGGGDPFRLSCHDDTSTILIDSQNFTVQHIDPIGETMSLVRTDLLQNVCDPKREDTYVNPNPTLFKYPPHNITIFYDCPPIPIPGAYEYNYNFSCGNTFSYFEMESDFEMESELLIDQWLHQKCKPPLHVPAADVPGGHYNLTHLFDTRFKFNVSYDVPEKCTRCLGKEGNCTDYGTHMDENVLISCYPCPDGSNALHCSSKSALNLPRKIIIGVAVAVMGGFVICIITCYSKCMSSTQVNVGCTINDDHDIEAFLKNHGALAQRRYKFSEVKKMTNSFKVKLGEGGFGAVYKGEMLNACPVAVKILDASKGNGEDFINEVASISRTAHVNVVTLVGFCLEGHKKALIYEFMPNGSLDKFIYNKGQEMNESLSWDNLWQIAVGIARGLEYLHRGCNTRILHFDIKPHNILLDDKFCPKISDFGLAKLCPRNESIISMSNARGTIGYVAPEVWNKHFGGISHKSDVYSYGMMLLEVVGVKKNINAEASKKSSEYFPDWIYNRLEQDRDLTTDGVIATEENEIARRMTIVGLWCVQTFPKDRPTMSRVIEMLEGNMNSLEIPPKPVLSSPTRSVPELTTSSFQSG